MIVISLMLTEVTTIRTVLFSLLLADTSFMYMIAGLCMLKLYQTRHPDINASAYSAYASFAVVICLAVLGVVGLCLIALLYIESWASKAELLKKITSVDSHELKLPLIPNSKKQQL